MNELGEVSTREDKCSKHFHDMSDQKKRTAHLAVGDNFGRVESGGGSVEAAGDGCCPGLLAVVRGERKSGERGNRRG